MQERQPEDRRHENPATVIERHGQTVVAAVALAILLWVGVSVNDNSKFIPVLSTKITSLEKQVVALTAAANAVATDQYRVRDAVRDFAIVSKEVDQIRSSIAIFGREQSARGPRIKNVEEDIRELYKLYRDIDHTEHKKRVTGSK